MEPWRKNLTRLIEAKGADEIRRVLGVKAPTVTRWKKGQRWPEPGMVLRICNAFGITLDQLYGVQKEGELAEPAPPWDAVTSTRSRARIAKAMKKLDEARELLAEESARDPQRDDVEARGAEHLEAGRKARRRPRSGAG